MTRYDLTCDGESFAVEIIPTGGGFLITVEGTTYTLDLKKHPAPNLVVELSGKPVTITLHEANSRSVEFTMKGERLAFERQVVSSDRRPHDSAPLAFQRDVVTSPMPAKVIATLVKPGEKVKAGDPLVIIESMKMEIAVRSDREAEVLEILVEVGASVKKGQGLVRLA
ncbi:MAG TPA: biotin/lipoyl-containing protein [Nitrososphaerales archaeon]|nr:biotin/lipoyl-containing protein [Nitrososphaerales archaeon]